jgi:hypothetical protein
MTLSVISVVVPYQLGAETATASVQVSAVTENAAGAQAVAQQLAQAWAALHHPGRAPSVRPGRAKVPATPVPVDGPFAYVLSRHNHIHHLAFPARIDGIPGERLGHQLAGLDDKLVYGLAMDCAQLEYINTVGLTGLANHVKRLRLHLYQVPSTICKVLDIVGLSRLLQMHDNLAQALAGIVADQAGGGPKSS